MSAKKSRMSSQSVGTRAVSRPVSQPRAQVEALQQDGEQVYVAGEEIENPFGYMTIGFRGYRYHTALVALAAKRKRMSAANYLRQIVMPAVAADLDIPVPEYESLAGALDDTAIKEAAKRAGLSVNDYARRAAALLAAQELERDEEVERNVVAPVPSPGHGGSPFNPMPPRRR